MTADLEKILLSDDPVAACEAFRDLHQRLRSEIGRVLVGQDAIVEQMLIALFAKEMAYTLFSQEAFHWLNKRVVPCWLTRQKGGRQRTLCNYTKMEW